MVFDDFHTEYIDNNNSFPRLCIKRPKGYKYIITILIDDYLFIIYELRFRIHSLSMFDSFIHSNSQGKTNKSVVES